MMDVQFSPDDGHELIASLQNGDIMASDFGFLERGRERDSGAASANDRGLTKCSGYKEKREKERYAHSRCSLFPSLCPYLASHGQPHL